MKQNKKRSLLFVSLLVIILLSSSLVLASYPYQKYTIVCDKGKTCGPYNISYVNNAAPEAIDYIEAPMFSIPIMTVPGRGGLDFPITLDYRAGIKVKDEASWVGLGWNLNTMAITSYGNGSEDYHFSPFGRLVRKDDGNYTTEDWSAINISYDLSSGSITSWTVIDLDGAVYIFDKVVRSGVDFYSNKTQMRNSAGWLTSFNGNHSYDWDEPYAWYLTQIRSNDYVDDGDGIPDDDDIGSWINIAYSTNEEKTYRYPSHGYEVYNITTYGTSDALIKSRAYDMGIDFTYISSITTPSYVATFYRSYDREDAASINRIYPYTKWSPPSLDRIELKEVGSNNILRAVDFGYASGDDRLAGNKLTLENLTFYGESRTTLETSDPHLPSTYFYYDYNPTYNPYAYDLWEYYNGEIDNDNNINCEIGTSCTLSDLDNHEVNPNSVAAWSLTNITWPSGGKTSYVYESNDYTWEQNNDVATAYGEGIRVKSVAVDDGIGNIAQYNYSYGDGVATFIPKNDSMYLDTMPNAVSSIGKHSRLRVEYKDVTMTVPDYGSIKTEYITSYDSPDTTHSMDYNRSLVKAVYYKNTSGDIVKQVDYTYESGEIPGISDPRVSGYVNLIQVSSQLEGITKSVDYDYNSDNLMNKIIEYGPEDRITEIDYAYETESAMADKNMLVQTDEVRIYNESVSASNLQSKVKIGYDNDFGYTNQWYPDYTYVWNDTINNNYITVDYTSYDAYGNLENITDGRGNIFNIRYSSGYDYVFPTSGWNEEYGSVEDPAWSLTYDEMGNVKSSTGANEQSVIYEYDKFGRISNITYPGEPTSVFYEYYLAENDFGLSANNLNYVKVTQKIDGDTNLEAYSYYDGLGKQIYTRLEDGTWDIITKTEYDDIGIVTKQYEPYKSPIYFFTPPASADYITYDYEESPLLRINTIDPPGAGDVDFSFGSSGSDYTSSVIDENSNSIMSYVNKFGHLTKITDSDSNDINFVDKILGWISGITNQENQETANKFDNLGRLLENTNVDSGTTSFMYDDNSNLIGLDDAKNPALNYIYDKLDRLTDINYPTGTDINLTYDVSPPNPPTGLDNPIGRLTTITDNAGTTHYYYDSQGRLGQINKSIDGVDYVTKYFYDYNDNIITIIDKHGREINYTYNTLNQISNIYVNGDLLVSYTYNAEGTISNEDYGEVGLEHTYTSRNWLNTTYTYNSTDIIFERHYVYDNVGNLIGMYNTTDASNQIAGFAYDNLYALTNVTDYNDFYGNNYSYTYDKIGNRMSKKVGFDLDDYVYFSGTNLLQSDSVYNYTYDANGNRFEKLNALTGDLVMNYTYDYDNQLIRVDFPDGTNVRYVYDAWGSLIKKIDRCSLPINFYAGETEASNGVGDGKFTISDSSENKVGLFDDNGNIVLSGTCTISGDCTDLANNVFVIRDSGGSVVAYIDSDGDLCAEDGSCSAESSCTPAGYSFKMTNDEGDVVSYIDYNGKLCFTGKIVENGNVC